MPIYIKKGTTLEKPVKRVFLEGKEMKIVRSSGAIQHMRTRLIFNSNRSGVSNPPTIERTWGAETLGPLPSLTSGGSTVSGWYTQSQGGTKVSPNDITPMGNSSTRNYNLYARWDATAMPLKVTYEITNGEWLFNIEGEDDYLNSSVDSGYKVRLQLVTHNKNDRAARKEYRSKVNGGLQYRTFPMSLGPQNRTPGTVSIDQWKNSGFKNMNLSSWAHSIVEELNYNTARTGSRKDPMYYKTHAQRGYFYQQAAFAVLVNNKIIGISDWLNIKYEEYNKTSLPRAYSMKPVINGKRASWDIETWEKTSGDPGTPEPAKIAQPTIGSSISCVISGSEYKVSVEVTNNHSRAVALRVSIGGNSQSKTTQPYATNTFEQTYAFSNRPSGSIQVTAQARKLSTNSTRLALLGRMDQENIGLLGPNVDAVPRSEDINTFVCSLNRYYVDINSEQWMNGEPTYNVYECAPYTVPEPLDNSIVVDKALSITCPAIPSLQTPTIASTGSCVTSGYANNPNYQYRIDVTNNDTKQVRLNVTIEGSLTTRLVSPGASSTFTRNSSTPLGLVTVSAYASLDGYVNSSTTTESRRILCEQAPPAPTGGTWHKIRLSSSPVCVSYSDDLEGTPCTTIGETTTASSGTGPCYDYECKL